MGRNFFVSFSLVLCMGCTPLSLYYKENTPVDRLNRDQAACKIEAIKAVPVNRETRIIRGTKTPRIICDGTGACRKFWVKTTPDRIETYDANEGLRAEYANQCMALGGYQKVRLPPCPNDVVKTTRLVKTRVLPRSTPTLVQFA